MSQQITNFFISVDLTDTTPPSTLQSNSSHTPSRRRPWLEYQIIDNKIFMFCTICQKAKGNSLWVISECNTMKLEFVKRHENSVEHKNSLQILNSSQTGIKEGINQMLEMGMNTNLVNYQKEHPTSM
ncbi:10779_t:CDS:2, partial [Funneliformis caledonium]